MKLTKTFLLFFLLIVNTLFTHSIQAETNHFFDFDQLKNGELNGQLNWDNNWNSLVVQNQNAYLGKAVQNQSECESLAYQEIPNEMRSESEITFAFKIDNNYWADNQEIIGVYNGIEAENHLSIKYVNNYDQYQNTLLVVTTDYPQGLNLGSVSQGTWNFLTLSWRQADYKFKISYHDKDFPWLNSAHAWDEQSPFGIRIRLPEAQTYGNFYLDTLLIPPPIINDSYSFDDISETEADQGIITIDYIAY